MMRAFLAGLLMLASLAPAFAVEPDEILQDAVLESRARALSAGLRCLICQNQSIDDSDASLAKDLRTLIRERITLGDSDGEVEDYVVGRYGEFVLLKPRLSAHTLLLWGAPFALVLFGFAGFLRRRVAVVPAEAPLSAAEQDALNRALER